MLTDMEDILFYLLTIAVPPYLIGKLIYDVKNGVFVNIKARKLYCLGRLGFCSCIILLIHMVYCFNFSTIIGRYVFMEWGWMALVCPISIYLELKGNVLNEVQLVTENRGQLQEKYHMWKRNMKIMLFIEFVMVVVVGVNIVGAIVGGEQSPIVHNWNKIIESAR